MTCRNKADEIESFSALPDEQFHGNFFQLDGIAVARQFIAPAIQLKFMEFVQRRSQKNHDSGRFILDATDTSGNPGAHILGVIKATRITINTPVSSFF